MEQPPRELSTEVNKMSLKMAKKQRKENEF